jgi:hypothetical protein
MNAHTFIGALIDQIIISPAERASALGCVARLETAVRQRLPYIKGIEPIGSVVRGTALSRKVDPTADVDCLVLTGVNFSMERFPNVPVDDADLLLNQEICNALSSTGMASSVTLDHPWVRCECEGHHLELSICMQDDKTGGRSLISRANAWGEKHPEIWLRYGANAIGLIYDGNVPSKTTLAVEQEYHVNYAALKSDRQRTQVRGVVLLLKYWNWLYEEGIPSFVLEKNVTSWIIGDKPVRVAESIFLLACTFLRSDDNFDTELLNSRPSFLALKEALLDAEALTEAGKPNEAAMRLGSVLPWPAHAD